MTDSQTKIVEKKKAMKMTSQEIKDPTGKGGKGATLAGRTATV